MGIPPVGLKSTGCAKGFRRGVRNRPEIPKIIEPSGTPRLDDTRWIGRSIPRPRGVVVRQVLDVEPVDAGGEVDF